MTAVAYVLCDVLHEFGHAAATLLPLGVKALSISTIGLTTSRSHWVVAACGPFVNLVLGLGFLFAPGRARSPAWRYFAWLFGTVSLFNATAYPVYSAILGSGDFAVVFDAFAPPSLWRPIVCIVGLAVYWLAIRASLAGLRRLVIAGVIAGSHIDRYCMIPYWIGGSVVTAGAVFNPQSPWFILTSGAAVGFGAMAGLALLPPLLKRSLADVGQTEASLRIGHAWIVAGAVAATAFIGVMGPGLRLAG